MFSLLLEREEEWQEGRERNIDGREKHQLVTSCMSPQPGMGDRTRNLGMCPNQKSNLQSFTYGTTLHLIEPHWPGKHMMYLEELTHNRFRKGSDKW